MSFLGQGTRRGQLAQLSLLCVSVVEGDGLSPPRQITASHQPGEHNKDPLGVAQEATLLILKPLSFQTAISTAENEDEPSSVLTVTVKTSLLRKSIPAHCSNWTKSHPTECTTRLGCCGAAVCPDLSWSWAHPGCHMEK